MSYELVVGVSGGIAAYKTAAMVSKLVQSGVGVSVVMTDMARQFVGPLTFEALTGRGVPRGRSATPEMPDSNHPLGVHIEVARRADVMCVAPATANVLAKAAHGLADDLLSTLILAFDGPIVLAPAMNSEMWSKPSVQRNLATLREDGFTIVDPEEGWLSCRTQGVGRMAAPEKIIAVIEEVRR